MPSDQRFAAEIRSAAHRLAVPSPPSSDAGRHDHYPIVRGKRVGLGVDARFVGVAATDRAAQVVRDDDLGAAAEIAQPQLVVAGPGELLHATGTEGADCRRSRHIYHRARSTEHWNTGRPLRGCSCLPSSSSSCCRLSDQHGEWYKGWAQVIFNTLPNE